MVKKLIIDHNEKGEIVSPSYVDIVSKINEIIEILSIEKVDDKDCVNSKSSMRSAGFEHATSSLGS